MTNNLLRNRVIGHEHGLWTPGASMNGGKALAAGKMCNQNSPFLESKIYFDF